MPRALGALIVTAVFWSPFAGTRGQSEPIVFEARPPTEHSQTCPVCRFGPPEPFGGSFVATLANVGDAFEEYSLSEVRLWPQVGSLFGFGGTGTLIRRIGVLPAVEMTLDLISPDYLAPPGRIQLHGQSEETSADWWPVVRLTLSGTTENAYTHTIRLSAAPRAEYRWYQLGAGSQFVDECLTCDRLPLVAPLAGRFLLGRVEENPLFATFRLDTLEFHDSAGRGILISGEGRYQVGGEVALTQSLDAEIIVRTEAGDYFRSLRLEGLRTVPGVPLLDLDATASFEDPAGAAEPHRYTLRLVATPSKPIPFRRGDTNVDGRLDLSDPIFLLFWLFHGGGEPPCGGAVDANADAARDVSDAILLLQYLFQAGPPPAAPGPEDCGPDPAQTFTCNEYPSC